MWAVLTQHVVAVLLTEKFPRHNSAHTLQVSNTLSLHTCANLMLIRDMTS